MSEDKIWNDEDLILEYTDQDGIDDGILVDLRGKIPHSDKSMVNIATTNLMHSHGYMDNENTFQACIIDLMLQSHKILKRACMEAGEVVTFASGMIETPKGYKIKIFLGMNGTGKFTAMLPEDY